jgi:hypothetical protein
MAVLAAGGLVAMAGPASAAQAPAGTAIPIGTSSDAAYSGIGPASSLYSVANTAPPLLAAAAQLLDNAGDTAMTNGGSAWTAAAAGNDATQIVADFTGEPLIGTAPTAGNYLATLKSTDPTYSSDVVQMRNLGTLYAQVGVISTLASFGASAYPGGLYSVNGDLSVTSAATVVSTSRSAAYSMTMAASGAAATSGKAGYVVPVGETLTFPADFSMNLGLIKDEIPYSDIYDPSSGGKPIGTVTMNSPSAFLITGDLASTQVTGEVYVVKNPNPDDLVPYMELWIGPTGDSHVDAAVLGTLSGVTFPMTVTFGLPAVVALDSGSPGNFGPLPLSSLAVTFPAATSPFKVNSCTAITAPAATVTDFASPFASDFGDYSDGFDAATGSAGPVSLSSAKTVVTDDCPKLTASSGTATGVAAGKPAFGYTLRSTQPFSTLTTTLPSAFRFSKFAASDVSVSGTTGAGTSAAAVTVTKASVSGGTLTLKLSGPVTKVAVKLTAGIRESKTARKDKTFILVLGVIGASIHLKITI